MSKNKQTNETPSGPADKRPRVETYELPAYWASYLINCDDSGLDGAEIYAADKFLAEHNLPLPISCEPAGFGRPDNGGLRCDLETYTFLI
jgi:hypothetical protein